MTNLPKKLTLPHSQTKHVKLYETVNALIDFLAEREPQPPKPRSIWDLRIEDGEKYWALWGDGSITSAIFTTLMDERVRVAGGAFLTKEEAEAERARRMEFAKTL